MSADNKFTPRLGKIRDRGRKGGKTFRQQLKRTAAQLGASRRNSGYTGRNAGRGYGAAPQAKKVLRNLQATRMRRVIVKVHIARASKSIGARAFSQHLHYIQRDGVEQDGSGGKLYDRERDEIDGRSFAQRSTDDRHQFRLTLSVEDASKLGDLKATTRELLVQMEQDLETRLDWVAVDHHNTGHPHTHLVIRGRCEDGSDLVIARNYLMGGIRGRAQQIVTDALGPRRDLDIARAAYRDIGQDRFTAIDREIARQAEDGQFRVVSGDRSGARFKRSLQMQRLEHLEDLHLANRVAPEVWQLKDGWESALKVMGRRGDVVRALAANWTEKVAAREFKFVEERPPGAGPMIGAVLASAPQDELEGSRFLIIEDMAGERWHVPLSAAETAAPPPNGAIVEVTVAQPRPRPSDKVIAGIAERTGGHYSDALHAKIDPGASAAYRTAHKRRLEALRRAGLVRRRKDGVWDIGEDYLKRAAKYEAEKGGQVRVEVRSWMSLEAQVSAHAETWLDGQGGELEGSSVRLTQARTARLEFLRREGLLSGTETQLPDEMRRRLRQAELAAASSTEAGRSGRQWTKLENGRSIEAKFERTIDLAGGRMALVGNEHAFALVPWRPELERYRGETLRFRSHAKTVSWSFPAPRTRGLGR